MVFKGFLKSKEKKEDLLKAQTEEKKTQNNEKPPEKPQINLPTETTKVQDKIKVYERTPSITNRRSTNTPTDITKEVKIPPLVKSGSQENLVKPVDNQKVQSPETTLQAKPPSNNSSPRNSIESRESRDSVSEKESKPSKSNTKPEQQLKHQNSLKIEVNQGVLESVLDAENVKLEIELPNEEIFLAIHDENMSKIEELISANPKLINHKDAEENTPLIYASYHGFHEIVSFLIHKGASLDVHNQKGYTALHYAAFKGHRDCVYQLISKGAGKSKSYSHTPFMFALKNNHFTICFDFLLFGYNINEKNVSGYSALHLAGFRSDIEVFSFLIKNKANINLKDDQGNTPLVSCIYSRFKIGIGKLSDINECDFQVKNNKGQNILHLAILTKNVSILEFLFNLKKEIMLKLVNDGDKEMNRTPLQYAILINWLEMIPRLIDIPQTFNHQDSNGDNSLHLAAKTQNLLAYKLLLNVQSQPPLIDTKNNEKNTPKNITKSITDFKKLLETVQIPPKKNLLDHE